MERTCTRSRDAPASRPRISCDGITSDGTRPFSRDRCSASALLNVRDPRTRGPRRSARTTRGDGGGDADAFPSGGAPRDRARRASASYRRTRKRGHSLAMKLGFDATPLIGAKTGVGYHVEYLIAALARRYAIDE